MYDRNYISNETRCIIDFQNCLKESIISEKEMFSSYKVLRTISESKYFNLNGKQELPEAFKQVLNESKYI